MDKVKGSVLAMGPFTLSRRISVLTILAFLLVGCGPAKEPSFLDPEPELDWKRAQIERFEKASSQTSPLTQSELLASSIAGSKLCWLAQTSDKVTLWLEDWRRGDDTAKKVETFAFSQAPFELSLAPDGKRCLLLRADPALEDPLEQAVLELWDLSTGQSEVLSRQAAFHFLPTWLDDSRIVFAEKTPGRVEVFEKQLGGKAQGVLVSEAEFPRLVVAPVDPKGLVIYDRSSPLDTRGWLRESRDATTLWKPFALQGRQVRITGRTKKALYVVVRVSENSSQVLELPSGALDLGKGHLSLVGKSVASLGVADYVCQKEGQLVLLCAGTWGQTLKVLDLTSGALREVDFPASPGQAHRLRPAAGNLVGIEFEGLFQPRSLGLLDVNSGKLRLIKEARLEGLTPSDFRVESAPTQVRITHVKPDPQAPVLLESYGAFRQKLLPFYDTARLEWLRRGGVIEIFHLQVPPRAQDLAVSAVLEQAERHKGRALVYRGRSSGATLGLVAGLRRPDLFGAIWADAGLTDMANFPAASPGKLWTGEYGDPSVPSDLARLKRFSPLGLLAETETVPTILLTTSPSDPVVDPRHSWKFLEIASKLGFGDQVFLQQQAVGSHGVLIPRLEDQTSAVDFLWQRLQAKQNR